MKILMHLQVVILPRVLIYWFISRHVVDIGGIKVFQLLEERVGTYSFRFSLINSGNNNFYYLFICLLDGFTL